MQSIGHSDIPTLSVRYIGKADAIYCWRNAIYFALQNVSGRKAPLYYAHAYPWGGRMISAPTVLFLNPKSYNLISQAEAVAVEMKTAFSSVGDSTEVRQSRKNAENRKI